MAWRAEISQLAGVDTSQADPDRSPRGFALRTGERIPVVDRGNRAGEVSGAVELCRSLRRNSAEAVPACRSRKAAGECDRRGAHQPDLPRFGRGGAAAGSTSASETASNRATARLSVSRCSGEAPSSST